jgi:hypothetical protein
VPKHDQLGVAEGSEVRRLRIEEATFAWWRDAAGIVRTRVLTGAEVPIGRALGNPIVFDHISVSAVHARLLSTGGEWFIEDHSRNGTEIAEDVAGKAPDWSPLRAERRRLTHPRNLIRLAGKSSALLHVELRRPAPMTDGPDHDSLLDGLSPIYIETLLALCHHKLEDSRRPPATNQEIADQLFLSMDAVKDRISKLYRHFGIHARPREARNDLANRALDEGLASYARF